MPDTVSEFLKTPETNVDASIWGVKVELSVVVNELKNLRLAFIEMKESQKELAAEAQQERGHPCVLHPQYEERLNKYDIAIATCRDDCADLRSEMKIVALKVGFFMGIFIVIVTALVQTLIGHFMSLGANP